jgi:hypothetical protein
MKVELGPFPDDCDEQRLVDIHIDRWDTWNMDDTLALIILPMLKQLKETKHGSPWVDDEDVPHMPRQGRSSNESAQYDMFASDEHDKMVWENTHKRWEWVMDEMIWAFEMLNSDEYYDGLQYEREIHERIQRATTLFGKYYRGLWD